MSDYTKTVDFAAKDALASGNAAKAAKGTEVDTEYNNIATAIATKFDVNDRNVANGLCPLDASSLVPPTNLPLATEIAIGARELATSAEATALTSDITFITPLKAVDTFKANILTGDTVTGLLDDIWRYIDPASDTLWGWDDVANALIDWRLGTGLSFNNGASTVDLDFLGLEDLVDPAADRLIGWDDTAGFLKFWNTADGLRFDNAAVTFGLTDVAADATNAIDILAGVIHLDFSSLTAIDVTGTAPTDSFVVNDGGVLKQIDIQDMGTRVVNTSIAQTFALADANTYQVLTGAAAITWDIPTNAAEAFKIGTMILLGARDTGALTISPNTSAVTLTSDLRSGVGPTAGDHTVTAGGMAMLIKVLTNEWMITGAIT